MSVDSFWFAATVPLEQLHTDGCSVSWHDTRFGCDRSHVQFPEQPCVTLEADVNIGKEIFVTIQIQIHSRTHIFINIEIKMELDLDLVLFVDFDFALGLDLDLDWDMDLDLDIDMYSDRILAFDGFGSWT